MISFTQVYSDHLRLNKKCQMFSQLYSISISVLELLSLSLISCNPLFSILGFDRCLFFWFCRLCLFVPHNFIAEITVSFLSGGPVSPIRRKAYMLNIQRQRPLCLTTNSCLWLLFHFMQINVHKYDSRLWIVYCASYGNQSTDLLRFFTEFFTVWFPYDSITKMYYYF